MAKPYHYEDGEPGRPKVEIDPSPKWLSNHVVLMKDLDIRGWYLQLASRVAYEIKRDEFADQENWPYRPVTDPEEIDAVMCRTTPVALCQTPQELEVAQFNGRIVLEVDPNCPEALLFQEIVRVLRTVREKPVRQVNTRAWAEHRILAMYDLKLADYDLSAERKQLAAWLFPEIENQKTRGDKYDRAREYLDDAIGSIPTLRAQSQIGG